MGSKKPTQLFITAIILDVKIGSSIYETFHILPRHTHSSQAH